MEKKFIRFICIHRLRVAPPTMNCHWSTIMLHLLKDDSLIDSFFVWCESTLCSSSQEITMAQCWYAEGWRDYSVYSERE